MTRPAAGPRRIDCSDQYLLPLNPACLKRIAWGPGPDYLVGKALACMAKTNKNRSDDCEYKVGVTLICPGKGHVRFASRDFGVMTLLKPHIGFGSAVLLELLGYRTLSDLARSGYHLGAIPSIGPKKTEKILRVVESYGFAPPRRPAPGPRYWQAAFNYEDR